MANVFTPPARVSNVNTVEIVELIRVVSVFGRGVEGDPIRSVTEYFDKSGALVARVDPVRDARGD